MYSFDKVEHSAPLTAEGIDNNGSMQLGFFSEVVNEQLKENKANVLIKADMRTGGI